jgi:hypothetical protein
MAGEFADGVWYVDLAPISDPDLVPVTVACALGLLDDPAQARLARSPPALGVLQPSVLTGRVDTFAVVGFLPIE